MIGKGFMSLYREALLGKSDERITAFTSSLEEDKLIVKEVIEVLIAHTSHLRDKGLIPQDAAVKILNELSKLLKDSSILFTMNVEDVHEAIELYLRNVVGDDAGWLALGRSRNDHVAAALRLKTKKTIIALIGELINLRSTVINKARKYVDVPLPTFTHLQPAQISTVAHYLTYIEESLRVYTNILNYTLTEVIDKSPLGSGASTGTIVPIDRHELARLLGFSDVLVNTLFATSSRDFISITASIVTSLLVALSRIAEDFIIWCTPQYDYIIPPSTHLSTSSIMPHKRNLVTMEVIRALGGEAIGHLTAILSISKGVPSGYNLDLQEINKHLLRLLLNTLEAVTVFRDFMDGVEFNVEKIRDDIMKYPLTTTELAEFLSLKLGVPYREAHRMVASVIKEVGGNDLRKICEELSRRLGVDVSDLNEVIDFENALRLKKVVGSPNPEVMSKHLREVEDILLKDREKYMNLRSSSGVGNEL